MTLRDPEEVRLQLAMFLQRRDAQQFGLNGPDGLVHPTWEEVELAQERYLNDAEIILVVVQTLGFTQVEYEAEYRYEERDKPGKGAGPWVRMDTHEEAMKYAADHNLHVEARVRTRSGEWTEIKLEWNEEQV